MAGIIFVHGIGNTFNNPGWSKHIQKSVLEHEREEYVWNDLIETQEEQLFDRLFEAPSVFNPAEFINYYARKALFSYAMDATLYDKNKPALLEGLDKCYNAMESDDIIFAGYSLGSWICYDYVRTYTPDKYAGFITFGCNLPLRFGSDIQRLRGPWTNIWENSDLLSMPLKKPFVRDIEFKSRDRLLGWNLAAHMSYLTSKEFGTIFADEVKTMA